MAQGPNPYPSVAYNHFSRVLEYNFETGRIPVPVPTPLFIGASQDPTSAATGTANEAYFNLTFVPGPVVVNAIRFVVGVQSGHLDVGIYDVNGKRLVSSGSTVCPASGVASIALTPTALPAGNYYLAVAIDNGTITLNRTGSDALVGNYSVATSFPLPTTFTPGTVTQFRNYALAGLIVGGPTV